MKVDFKHINTVKKVRWLRLFGQFFRFDKWNVCQG